MAYVPMKNYPHDAWCDKCGRLFPAYLPCQTCPQCVQADTKSTFDGFNAKFQTIGSQPIYSGFAMDFAKAEEKVFASMVNPSGEQVLYTPTNDLHSSTWPMAKIAPKSSPKIVPLKAANVTVSQQYIMRVGLLSNCNIAIQQYVNSSDISTTYRLFCTKCRTALQTMDYSMLQDLPPLWLKHSDEFCIAHKHETQVTQTVTTGVSVEIRAGRKYRDE